MDKKLEVSPLIFLKKKLIVSLVTSISQRNVRSSCHTVAELNITYIHLNKIWNFSTANLSMVYSISYINWILDQTILN